MLPNHAPLVIAEQFGTLASLYPGRIDLGLGRAPGTDQLTVRALRRDPIERRHLPAGRPRAAGATSATAARAGRAGDAGHGLARAALDPRLEPVRRAARRGARAARTRSRRTSRPTRCCRRSRSTARASSRPSSCSGPTRWSGVNVIAADDDAEARRLFTSAQQAFTNMLRGRRGQLPPPIDDIEAYWTPEEKLRVSAHAAPLVRRLARDGGATGSRVSSRRRGRRVDRRDCDPRPRGAAALLRALGRTLVDAKPRDRPSRLRRGLDDDQRVSVRVAQPEHRRHGAAPTGDLVVDVDAGGLQRGVVCVDVRGVEADAGLAAAGVLARRGRGERDRRRGSRQGDLDPALSSPIGMSTTFSKPSVST